MRREDIDEIAIDLQDGIVGGTTSSGVEWTLCTREYVKQIVYACINTVTGEQDSCWSSYDYAVLRCEERNDLRIECREEKVLKIINDFS